MRNIARRSFRITLYVTAVLILIAAAVAVAIGVVRPGADGRLYLNFILNMFKVIVAGFIVSMLGILIPAVANEERELFRQRKESRIAYSKAKTGIDYLKLRLATASLAQAAAAMQEAHFQKHQAELFDDFSKWIEQRYGPEMTTGEWDIMMYGRLFCARKVLEENAAAWDELSPTQRIALLDGALPTKPEVEAGLLPCP